MKSNATFYHAGCPVCVDAETNLVNTIDSDRYQVEVVHLGNDPGRIAEAESNGVKSVPALTIDSNTFHINFGASIEDLKA